MIKSEFEFINFHILKRESVTKTSNLIEKNHGTANTETVTRDMIY
jgi:hypothetical protein